MGLLAAMYGVLLVVAQFSCIIALVLGGGWSLPGVAWAVLGIGLLILVWAGLSLGAGNLTVMPAPRSSSTLSVRGIYRFIRHPMYTAVLLCGSAVAFGAPSRVRWVALAACAVVLVLKIRHEEALLTARHPDYPERMQGVKRLLPLIW